MINDLKRYVFETACRIGACDLSDTIVVAGAQRSGTTWLTEVLRALPGYKGIVEPMRTLSYGAMDHRRPGYRASTKGFEQNLCLDPEEEHSRLREQMRDILTGRPHDMWVWNFEAASMPGKLYELASNRKVIVKLMRAHRIMHWLLARFEVREAVVIIRHPCAVVASMLAKEWWSAEAMSEHGTRVQNIVRGSIPEPVYERFAGILGGIETHAGMLAARWCLDHYFLFCEHAQAGTYPWILTPYERLVEHGREEIDRVLNAMRATPSPPIFERLGVASHTASQDLQADAEKQLSKWQRKLSTDQIDAVLRVVDAFELGFYTRAIRPDYDRLMQLQRVEACPALS